MARRVLDILAPLFLVPLFLASLAPPAAGDAPGPGFVRVVHAWRPLAGGSVESYTTSGDPWLEGYFSWRAGGDAASGATEWAEAPPAIHRAVRAALSDSAAGGRLERGAVDFAGRMARLVRPADTLTVVLLAGAFEEPFVHYDVAGRPAVAVQLEHFFVALDSLDDESREWVASRRIREAEVALAPEDVFPWCAYAASSVFVPELRRRRMGDVASLAETVLLHGFATRFAAALYPESRFAGARPPVPDAALAALEPKWREIGAAWFPLGTEPYLAALYEPVVESAVPEDTTVPQAALVVGTRLAGEWLQATRVSRAPDEAAEISRLGRLPTLSAWGLLQY